MDSKLQKALTYLLTLLVGVCATGATMLFTVSNQVSSVGAKVDGVERLIEVRQDYTEREFTNIWKEIAELKKQQRNR